MSVASKGRSFRPGFVYLFESAYGYKIGRTRNLASRHRIFSVKLPFEIRLVHVIESEDYVCLERNLHRHFDDKRLNGEWFQLDDDDVEIIRIWDEKYEAENF